MFGKLIRYKVKKQKITIEYENGIGMVDLITDSIIHIFSPIEAREHNSKAIEGYKKQEISYETKKIEQGIEIRTEQVIVKVSDNFMVDFYDRFGTLICEDYRGNRIKVNHITEAEKEQIEAEGHQVRSSEKEDYHVQVMKALDGSESFYGLGDKTGFLNKKYYEYEMWNTDNPNPHVDSFKVLYKTIPFLIAKKETGVYGLFFDHTYRSIFDLGKESESYFLWASGKGNLDYYYIAGNKMVDILGGYTYLTGTTPVPQLWALGYHQSKWSYESEKEVKDVAKKFRDYKIPCDTIHLDIDYMDDYKVFTWNKEKFPDPKKMADELAEDGFKIVTIIDPGVKVKQWYFMYEEGKRNGYFVKTPEGEIYTNTVWPGEAAYPDYGNPDVRTWWGEKQKLLMNMGIRGVWNDMNEPTGFSGEIPDDVVFMDEKKSSDHAAMHNVYGHLMAKATYEGWKKQDKRRPFVITRACYSGTQKYALAWTGDNHSIWAHLQMAIPQLCNLGLSGMSFVGTDVGGFGSEVTKELLCRWVQFACFSPLFRNHCAKGMRPQEPWRFDQETLDIYRRYVKLRYAILPYLYDLFFAGEKTGLPMIRPLVLHYEEDKRVRELNTEFLVGTQMLVAPVVNQGEDKKMVYLPKGKWIDYWTGEEQEGEQYIIRDAPISICPIYMKAGSILPIYPEQAYIGEKEIDELTLYVYPGEGIYYHYQDDGESFAYQDGSYNKYCFTIAADGTFTAECVKEGYPSKYRGIWVVYKEKKQYLTLEEKVIFHLER